MENIVHTLEVMFQKADGDIKCLSHKLDLEFENTPEANVNPAKLMQQLNAAKKEYSSLVKQAAEIQELQRDAVNDVRGQMNDVCKLLITLQTKTGAERASMDKPEELVRLESLLNTQIPWASSETGASSSAGEQAASSQSTSNDTQSGSGESTSKT